MSTRIYSYGARPPTAGADTAADLLRFSHVYKIALCDLERDRRARYRAIERTVVPTPVVEALEAAEAEEARAWQVVRDARSRDATVADEAGLDAALEAAQAALAVARKQYRAACGPMREASAIAKDARATEKIARKEAKKRDRDDAAIARDIAARGDPRSGLASLIHAIDAWAASEQRRLRGSSGLPWGCYTIVEDEVQQAARETVGNPRHPRAGRFEGGRIGTPPLKGGIDVDALASGREFTLTVLPLPDGPIGRWTRERRHAVARIRTTGDEWIEWPVLLHRPLPAGRVAMAWAKMTPTAKGWRWEVQVAVDGAHARQAPPPADSACAIDLGWRATDAYRVGYVVDIDGRQEPIRAPVISTANGADRRRWRDQKGLPGGMGTRPSVVDRGSMTIGDAREHSEGIGAVRDQILLVAIGFVRQYAGDFADVPEWLVEETRTIHAWRKPGRMVALLRAWESDPARASGHEVIVDGLRAYRRRDLHLWQYQDGQRERAVRVRRDRYRHVASEIVKRYETIVLPATDFREFAQIDPSESDAHGRGLRKIQRDCAPSELYDAILDAASREGRRVVVADPAYDSRTCHACGHEEPIGAVLYHTCSACGATWDRDANAGINRLRKAGFDPTRALRCCVKQPDRSQGPAPTGGGSGAHGRTRTDRRAEGGARKMARKGAETRHD